MAAGECRAPSRVCATRGLGLTAPGTLRGFLGLLLANYRRRGGKHQTCLLSPSAGGQEPEAGDRGWRPEGCAESKAVSQAGGRTEEVVGPPGWLSLLRTQVLPFAAQLPEAQGPGRSCGGVSGHGRGFLGQLVPGPGQNTPAVTLGLPLSPFTRGQPMATACNFMLQARPSPRDFIIRSLSSQDLTQCLMFAKHLYCVCERVASTSFPFGGCAKKELQGMRAALTPSAQRHQPFPGSCWRPRLEGVLFPPVVRDPLELASS